MPLAAALSLGACAPSGPTLRDQIEAPWARASARLEEDVTGRFESRGGELGSWSILAPRCASATDRGFLAAEIYTRDPNDDTEVVVVGGQLEGPVVLVRVPREGRMVRLRRAECRRLEADVRESGVKIDGVRGVEGAVAFDCAMGGGEVSGEARFSCK